MLPSSCGCSSTLPYHCRPRLSPCLPAFPTSSFFLLLLPTDLFLSPLEGIFGLPVTSVSRSLRATTPKLSKHVRAGECKGRSIYFLFKVFSKDYFQPLNCSHSHEPVSKRAEARQPRCIPQGAVQPATAPP